MLLLTLLVLEGMARIAYYAAYNQWYGGGRLATPADYITPPPPQSNRPARQSLAYKPSLLRLYPELALP